MSKKKILIINGPNLNLLGKREPEIYGNQSFEEYLEILRKDFPDIHIEYYQTNHEGSIIDKLQEADNNYDGVILNPAGYTHTSVSIGDAVLAMTTPVVEIHISDISKRESFRQFSYVADFAEHRIMGKGLKGYAEAVDFFLKK